MPAQETFRPNDWPTLGVELELQLVDDRTMALKSAFADVFARTPTSHRDAVKPEFMQCYVELNSDVGRTVAELEADLSAKIRSGRNGGGRMRHATCSGRRRTRSHAGRTRRSRPTIATSG